MMTVESMPLVIAGHRLALGSPECRAINREIDGNGFVGTAQTGDWVSMHWGWACQVLSPRQVANLERWTRYHLDIVNETL
jgi:hydrogenase maturation factor